MQPLNIDQLVINGSAPLSYASEHVVQHILDINTLKRSSLNDSYMLFSHTSMSHLFQSDASTLSHDVAQRSSNDISQIILAHTSFSNKNITILLRSALISGTASFRRALLDFKITHQKIFAQELNQSDKHQNTLLWYLTIADLYSSIQELHQLTLAELNINVKNGPSSQTILHYVIINGNIKEIRIVLDIGIDTNLRDRFGRTALHYIALYGTKDTNDVEITKLLIDYGTLPNLEDNIRQTSLHYAIIKQNYDLVGYLITLPNINVCIKDKYGYSPLCYLCEHILNLSDISLENNHQCRDILEHIFKILNLIINRCPSDELSYNFHVTNNGKFGENLLLHVYNKLASLTIPLHLNTLFQRLEPIIIGTDQDHRLFVEQLLKLHSWKSAVFALCNTHNVNISNTLIQCIAHDPHVVLINHISPLTDLSIVFVLIFYALATNMELLRNIVPMCKDLIKDEQKTKISIDDNDKPMNMCHFNTTNFNLHTTYVTFIHTCLHYASFNVFSLKHLCRYHIRHYFKSNIINKIEKCSYLKLKHRDYLKLNELILIYSKIHDLSFIVYLIKRLYNIHQIDEYNLYENEINDNLKSLSQNSTEKIDTTALSSLVDTPSDDDTVQYLSNRNDTIENEYETKTELVYHRTIEEIMAESDISFHSLNDDSIDSKRSSQLSVKTPINDRNPSLKTDYKSTLSFSDDELSTEQFENELADMNAKTKDIEDLIEKFLLEK